MNKSYSAIRILALAICFLASLAKVGVAQPETKRPNLLFILTDDQRWDAVGYAGNPYIQTPNIDRLAKEGVVFTESFVNVTGVPVELYQTDGSVGAALGAGVGAHIFSAPQEAFAGRNKLEMFEVIWDTALA